MIQKLLLFLILEVLTPIVNIVVLVLMHVPLVLLIQKIQNGIWIIQALNNLYVVFVAWDVALIIIVFMGD